ncbi:hypothetical protein Barb6XT_00583 [Bacteroidales bacterium Barb6XT]|nr:hypothetical protein Barb6XT_00583 [Bacteroidales bacterium Barb6XT]
MKLHLFNPGYEAGVLAGATGYTPAANIQRMRRELAWLPVWYGNPEDCVLIEEDEETDIRRFLPDLSAGFPPLATPINRKLLTEHRFPELTAAPWGLSPQSLRLFDKLKRQTNADIHIPLWKDAYARLTHRQTAAECLAILNSRLSAFNAQATDLSEAKRCIAASRPPFVLKTPYSSSGRGLLWIHGNRLTEKETAWVRGAIEKQGSVCLERGLEKIKDFAMEFFIDEQGNAVFQGFSLFETAGKGAYSGNRLERQESLRRELTDLASDGLQDVQTAVGNVLQKVYGGIYTGYIGIDMMIYREDNGNVAVHPCVEINMRYTMGMVAVRLFERFMDANSGGSFQTTCSATAFADHCAMQEMYPRRWTDGRLTKGYLPLCPVRPDTHYRSYILSGGELYD